MAYESWKNLLFRIRYGFRGVPFELLGRIFRLDESLRRWQTEGERGVMEVIAKTLCPGDVFVDVGANFGLHTIVGASCVGPEGRVVAIEPVPANCSLLRRHLKLNGLDDQVTVIQKAATDSAGSRIKLHGVREGVSLAASMRGKAADGDTIEVAVTTLDDCLAGLHKPVRLIKIDVEGAEHLVIRGARKILQRDRPMLLVEVHTFALKDFDTSVEQFRDELNRSGYSERVIDVIEGAEGEYYHAVYEPCS